MMSLLFVLLVVSLLICINAWKSNNNVRMKCNNNNIIMSNDKFFGKQLTKSVVALLSTVVISTSPVNAVANKSPLYLGGSYAEVIDPKDATYNDELKSLGSSVTNQMSDAKAISIDGNTTTNTKAIKKNRILVELDRRNIPYITLKPLGKTLCRSLLETFVQKSVNNENSSLATGYFFY